MTNQTTTQLQIHSSPSAFGNGNCSDDRVSMGLEEYSASLEAGQPLSRKLLLAKYSDVADELIGCLDSLDFIRQVAPQLSDEATSIGNDEGVEIHPTASLGDFCIQRELGRGGMGVVYEAEQLSLGRRVALKVLPFAAMLDRQQLARFKNEARAAATLDHPNIVAIYSVGAERGVHYYAMQLIEGHSLAQVVETARRERNLPPPPAGEALGEAAVLDTQPVASVPTRRAPSSSLPPFSSRDYFHTIAQLGIQAAEALDHAHQNGVLHRDIKPANLLVDDIGKLWITDFGLARIEQDAGMTMTGDLLGTLRYMSPEQALAKRVVVDHRSDIYSLGVTLYELLTLQPAFAGSDRHELLRQIAFAEPRKPRQINARIPQDLETIILKAIEKNPADRYVTAKEFADDLQRFLNIQPIQAKPITRVQQVSRWVHRNTMVAGLLAAIAILSLAVAGTTTIGYLRTSAALSNAKAAGAMAAEERAVATAVNEFLQNDLLGLAAADRQFEANIKPDPNLMLRTLLDRAVATLDKRFANQPRVRAELQQTLAESYGSLGRPEDALPLWEQIRKYQEQSLGPEHRTTLSTVRSVAQTHRDLGQYDKAIELHEHVLNLRRKVLGDDHPETLDSLIELAECYRGAGKFQKALALQDETFRKIRKKFGPEHSKTLHSMNCLAVAYGSVGQNEKAIALQEQALALYRKVSGLAHPRTLDTMWYLGDSYIRAGQREKGWEILETALKHYRTVLGQDHRYTVHLTSNLANQYCNNSLFEKAVPLLEEAAESAVEAFGPDHFRTRFCRRNLALGYSGVGRFDVAISIGKQNLEAQRKAVGLDDPFTCQLMEDLGVIYLDAGQFELAQSLLAETLECRRKLLGASHADTLGSMRLLATAYRSAGQLDKACSLGEELIKLRRDENPPNHEETALALSELGATLIKQAKWRDAETLLRESLELLSTEADLHLSKLIAKLLLGASLRGQKESADADLLLVQSYPVLKQNESKAGMKRRIQDAFEITGHLYNAAELFEKAFESNRKVLGPEHGNTLYFANELVVHYLNAGRFEDAVDLGKQAVEMSAKIHGPEHFNTLIVQGNLAGAYSDDGQFDTAIALQEEAVDLMRKALGAEHALTHAAMEKCGWIYWEASQFEKAEAMLAETLDRRRRALGDSHADTLHSLRLYATACRSAGNIDTALALGRDLLHLRREQTPTDTIELPLALSELGATLLELQQWAESEALLRDALEVLSSKKEDENIALCAQCRLGASLRGQKRFAEAESLLVPSYTLLKQKEPRLSIRTKRSLQQAHHELVGLYEDWGKPEEADRWRRESRIPASD